MQRPAEVLLVALALGILVAVNVIASGSVAAWDLTRSGANSLAPESVQAAGKLNRDLAVVGFFAGGAGSTQTELEALVQLYAAQSSHVTFKNIDPTHDAADVKRYGVTEAGTVVLDLGGRTQLLLPGSQSERDFTAALMKLESGVAPQVCWSTGDGERDLTDRNASAGYSLVATLLAANSFTARDLVLTEQTAIPSDCALLVILDPTAALPTATVQVVDAYLSAGGRMLVASEPWARDPKVTASLNDVLSPFGAAFTGALVVEADPYRASNPTVPAVLEYGASPITASIQGQASFFPQATAVTLAPVAGVAAVRIASTTTAAYAVTAARGDLTRRPADAAGPFTLMATLQQQSPGGLTRIVAVGTPGFAQNGTLPPNNGDANLPLALDALQWLAGEDRFVTVAVKPSRVMPIFLSQRDQTLLIVLALAVMPGAVATAGIAAWWWRRRAARRRTTSFL